jgi:hypothetical protein
LVSVSYTYRWSRYSQITSQLGDVLDFPFPGLFGEIIEALQPIMDFWNILFRALGPSECFGLRGFAARWMLRVVVLPGILLVIVLFAFLYDRKTNGPAEANLRVKSNLFFVLFFTYPSICTYSGNNIRYEISRLCRHVRSVFLLTCAVLPLFAGIVSFAAFICKPISPDHSVLVMDDTTMCDDAAHVAMQWASGAVILVIAVGTPLALLCVLVRKSTAYTRDSATTNLKVAQRMSKDLGCTVDSAQYTIRDLLVGADFAFVMDGYDPQYIYWESFDMVRIAR